MKAVLTVLLVLLLSLLALVLLLCCLRVGIIFSFGSGAEAVQTVRMGPLRIRLRSHAAKEKKKESPPEDKKPAKGARERRPRMESQEVLDLLQMMLTALSRTAVRASKRMHIDPLDLTFSFGGAYDPALAASLYGAANVAMWGLMPRAEEVFDIPDPSLHLRVDFDAKEELSAKGTIGFSFRIGDFIGISWTLLPPLLRWFLEHRRARSAARSQAKDNASANADGAQAGSVKTA